jgi:hypothetical protein
MDGIKARVMGDLGLVEPLSSRAAAVVALVVEAARFHNPPFGPRYEGLLDLARNALWQHPDRTPIRTPGAHWSSPGRRKL